MASDITADMVNADCVHIRCWMFCALCWSCLVHAVDRFMNEELSVYDQVILMCFVCLLATQHTTLK